MDQSKVDTIFFRLKNHPVLSGFIAIGLIVIAMATFTDALKNVMATAENLIGSPEPAHISGYWVTEHNEKADPIYFEFKSVKDKLYGSVWLTPTTDMQNSHSGVLNGQIKGNHFSFTTEHTYIKTFGMMNPNTWIRSPNIEGVFVENYEGDINGNHIEFSRISNGSYEKLHASKTKEIKFK